MTAGAEPGARSRKNTLLRQIMLLQLIPRAPHWISAPEIRERLNGRGPAPSLRTIQRDLERLSVTLPLVCDQSGRPFGWMWSQSAPEISIPALDPVSAMVYAMVEEFLRPLLPPGMLERLQPRLLQARELLADGSPGFHRAWSARIRVLHRGPPLRPPAVDGRIVYTVSRALLRDCRLRARYRRRGSNRARSLGLQPRALVVHGNVPHLVASVGATEDPRPLALHRFHSAALDPRPCLPAPDFDLDAFLADGHFPRPADRRLRLVARISAALAETLEASPIGEDQRITTGAHGSHRLRASVEDSTELRSWLMAQGDGLVVERPSGLRAEIAAALRSAADHYA